MIAEVFHRRGLIERWGRGTNKILDEAKRAGCPEPEFEEIAGAFIVRFRPAEVRRGVSTQEADFSERVGRVLRIVRRSGPLGAPAILRELGEPLALRSLQRVLRELERTGLVESSGRGRAKAYRATRGS